MNYEVQQETPSSEVQRSLEEFTTTEYQAAFTATVNYALEDLKFISPEEFHQIQLDLYAKEEENIPFDQLPADLQESIRTRVEDYRDKLEDLVTKAQQFREGKITEDTAYAAQELAWRQSQETLGYLTKELSKGEEADTSSLKNLRESLETKEKAYYYAYAVSQQQELN